MSREEAISLASKYGLEEGIKYCIDVLNMSPEEALDEWDI